MTQKLVAMLAFVVLMCTGALADQAVEKKSDQRKPPTGLRLKLELADDHDWPDKSIRLRLTIENLGDSVVSVVRYWRGGSVQIDGPDGRYGFLLPPDVDPPLTDNDLIALFPGESHGQLIDLVYAMKLDENGNVVDPPSYLHATPGTYSITGSYLVNKSSFGQLTRQDVFLDQQLRSNTVKFTVRKEK